jgi:FKBP-type peptidyl-prolyl cis-trans isomerase FkpA
MKTTLAALAFFVAPALHAQEAAPKTEDQKVLYTIGTWLGQQVAPFNLQKDELKFVEAGLKDAVNKNKPAVDPEVYGPKLNELAHTRMAAKAETEKKKAAPFLEKAAKEKGAVKLPSGVVYVEEKAGNGASPKATDKVRVHYEGTLTDGKVFDSSIKRGQPAEFPLDPVIPCWTEGVQKMKVGGKAKLVCPADQAYGDRGAPPDIPGGATLVFQVELLDILK